MPIKQNGNIRRFSPVPDKDIQIILQYLSGEITSLKASKKIQTTYTNAYAYMGQRLLKAIRNGQLTIPTISAKDHE